MEGSQAWSVLVIWNVCILSPPLLRHVHSCLLMVEWLAALFPRAQSRLCYLLAAPFSYTFIASLKPWVPSWIHHTMYTVFNHYMISVSPLSGELHITPEIPVILTTSALQTCPIHLGALVLVGVLITLLLLRTVPYGQPKDTLCDTNREHGFGVQLIKIDLLWRFRPTITMITLGLQLPWTVLHSSLHQ